VNITDLTPTPKSTLTSILTDKQKGGLCAKLHTIIDLANSLQNSVSFKQSISEDYLDADVALVGHIIRSLEDVANEIDYLPIDRKGE
jgi:hypothetical protein